MCLTDFAMESKIEIIQINISGEDKPGMTSSLTDILARYDAFILDIGQANIHQSLTLGILFMTTSDKSGAILKELLFKASELGVMIRFTPITEEHYQAWSVVRARTAILSLFWDVRLRRAISQGSPKRSPNRDSTSTRSSDLRAVCRSRREPCHPRLHRAFGARYARR